MNRKEKIYCQYCGKRFHRWSRIIVVIQPDGQVFPFCSGQCQSNWITEQSGEVGRYRELNQKYGKRGNDSDGS